jgi:hypothetical protein
MERRLATQQLVQQDAVRPPVSSLAMSVPQYDLRSHVLSRPYSSESPLSFDLLCEAEVNQLDVA